MHYLVNVAGDEQAIDDQAEAEPHWEDSSVPVAAQRTPQAKHKGQGRVDEIEPYARNLGQNWLLMVLGIDIPIAATVNQHTIKTRQDFHHGFRRKQQTSYKYERHVVLQVANQVPRLVFYAWYCNALG